MDVKRFVHDRWLKDEKFKREGRMNMDLLLEDAVDLKQPLQVQLTNQTVLSGIPNQFQDGLLMMVGENDDIAFINVDLISMIRFSNPELDAEINRIRQELMNQTRVVGEPQPKTPLELIEE